MLAILALWSAGSHATIVNVLTPNVGELDEGWHGSIKAGVGALAGNEQRMGADLAAGVTWKRTDHLVALKASGDIAVAFGDLVARKAFTNARHRWLFADPVSSVAFLQIDHNAFRGLLVRDLAGGGIDVRAWRNTWTEAHLGVTVMAEHQVFDEGVIDEDAGLRARGSLYWTTAVAAEGVVLASTTFFQPRVDRPSNYRFLEELSLTVDVTKHLDWNVTARVERDSRPPTGIVPWDASFRSGLVLGF